MKCLRDPSRRPDLATALPHCKREALFVLQGEGTIRLGENAEEFDIEADDYVALPADECGTHEVTAADDGIRYLAASEMVDPEVTCYPNRDVLGIYVGSATGGDSEERSISIYLDLNAERDTGLRNGYRNGESVNVEVRIGDTDRLRVPSNRRLKNYPRELLWVEIRKHAMVL